MRTARIKIEGHGYYHVMTHLVAGTPWMGPAEKEQFRKLMRAYETFCGLRVLTYSIMGSHAHIFLEVPQRQDIDEQEIVRRMRAIYTPQQVRERLAQWALWRAQGLESVVQEDLARLRGRMYDLSQYMKTLKQRYSQWYNRHASRRGTLWEERFKSVVVEGSRNALMTMAAYIDLNAVRAGIVKDPKDYRWSGYGEALGGGRCAREGVRRLLETASGSPVGWNSARLTYRMMLYDRGEALGVDEKGRPIRSGIDSELVERVLREGGRLSRSQLLRCRVRYFSDSAVLGSREFVNTVFQSHRECFGPKRKEGARALRFGEWGGLCGARDLRKSPLMAPSPGGG